MRHTGGNLPGFGDPKTWTPCFNHPNDPRTVTPDEPWKVFVCLDCGEEVDLWERTHRIPIFCECCDGDMEES